MTIFDLGGPQALAVDADAAAQVFAAEEYYDESGFLFDEDTTWGGGRDDIIDLVGDGLIVSGRRTLYGPEVDLQWALCGDVEGVDDLMVGFHLLGTNVALMSNPVEMRALFAETHREKGLPLVLGIYTSIGQYLSDVLASLRGLPLSSLPLRTRVAGPTQSARSSSYSLLTSGPGWGEFPLSDFVQRRNNVRCQ